MTDTPHNQELELVNNVQMFEWFCLRPARYKDMKAVLRLTVTKKWSGWKVKDELIRSLGLKVGDTIVTEVNVESAGQYIDDVDGIDMFADGANADWLLENNVGIGSIIDCLVQFKYEPAPVGYREKIINKVSLVVLQCLAIQKARDPLGVSSNTDSADSTFDSLSHSLDQLIKSLT